MGRGNPAIEEKLIMATKTFATVANVKTYLPDSLPTELTDAIILNRIQRVSDRVMGALSDFYAIFPNVDAEPATPEVIQEVTEYGAAYACLVFMALISKTQASEHYKEMYEYLLGQLTWQTDDDGKIVGPPLVKLTGFSSPGPLRVGKIDTGDDDDNALWNYNED
jgi:hypothetical protein